MWRQGLLPINLPWHALEVFAVAACVEDFKGPPIDFRTDAAPDVTALIQRSGIPREYTVTRAGPQNHESVGSVERGVREVKEGIATLRLELAKENCDLQDINRLQTTEILDRVVVGWSGFPNPP